MLFRSCRSDVNLTSFPVSDLMPGIDPGVGLSQITYAQYQYLAHYVSMMDQDPKESVDGIFSVITDPSGAVGESAARRPEELFGKVSRRRRKKLIARLDFFKTAVSWYVVGSLRLLADQFPKVFAGGGGGSAENVFESQLRLLDSLADGDVTRRDQVRRSNLWDVMHNLQMRIEKNEEKNLRHCPCQ